MALNDIKLHKQSPFGATGTIKRPVAASATLIYPGEPVIVASLGDAVVIKMLTNEPVVATDFVVGVAMSTSTNTATAAGSVEIMPMMPEQVWAIVPNAPTSWDTQAEYDALIGDRVLIDLTGTSFTILAADGATYGCVIQPLDIAKFPNTVAFSFRNGASYLA